MTLSFLWATNANYSSGPDTGTATKVNPASTANGFVAGTIAAPQHINFLFDAVGDEIAKAVDGAGGGTYTLSANLIFNGAGELRVGSVGRVLSGATFIGDAGSAGIWNGEFTFNDLVTFDAGSVLDIQDQAQLSAGALFTVIPTAVFDVLAGATVEFNASEDLKIDDVLNTYFLTLTPQATALSSDIPTWQPLSPPCAGWIQKNVSAQFQISFALNLPVGDSIVSLTAAIDGAAGVGHGGTVPTGADRLTVSLVRVDGGGNVTTVASLADAAVAGTGAGEYDQIHSVVLQNGASGMTGTLPHTVLSGHRYCVMVAGETGANAVANTTAVLGLFGDCVARSYRSAAMVY